MQLHAQPALFEDRRTSLQLGRRQDERLDRIARIKDDMLSYSASAKIEGVFILFFGSACFICSAGSYFVISKIAFVNTSAILKCASIGLVLCIGGIGALFTTFHTLLHTYHFLGDINILSYANADKSFHENLMREDEARNRSIEARIAGDFLSQAAR